MTKVALDAHKKELIREVPNFARQKFLYRLSRADYEREWGTSYSKPGFGTRLLAGLLRVMPRVGPFKGLGFNNPTPQTEDLYIKSIDLTVDRYRGFLEEVRAGKVVLPDCDLDSGSVTKAAEYSLSDKAYANLLVNLSKRNFDRTMPGLRENVLEYYSDLSLPIETRKDPARWQTLLTELDQLRAARGAVAMSAVTGSR
jgi:hypothetical protein